MNVKIYIYIFSCFLFSQTSASFFDEFRGAMSSVENSFGRLLNDVVTDVRDTIGCTILAVKQVLALGGIFHESSEYDARCRGINNAPAYVQETNNNYAPAPPIILTTPSVFIATTPANHVTEKSVVEKVTEEIEASIKNVNQTMFELIGKSNTHEKMENVSNSLLNESERLNKISALLHQELSNISEDVKSELTKVDPDIDSPTIQAIWSHIRALHDIELNHRNTPEAAEVHHILEEILRVLRGYNYQSEVAEININNTFTQLQDRFLKMEEEESHINSVEDILETDLSDSNNIEKAKDNDFPVTFKEVAKKIMDETTRTLRLDNDSQEFEKLAKSRTQEVPAAVETDENFEVDHEYVEETTLPPEYASIFQMPPQDIHARKQAAKDAQKLIEKSKETEAFMNDYFKKSDEISASVFDDPDLFNFGK